MKHLLAFLLLLFVLFQQNSNAQSMGQEAAAAPKNEISSNLKPNSSLDPEKAPVTPRDFARSFMAKHRFNEALRKGKREMEHEKALGWAALGLGLFFVIGLTIGILAIMKARKEGLVGLGLGLIGVLMGFFALVAFLIAIPFFVIWLKWKRRQNKAVF